MTAGNGATAQQPTSQQQWKPAVVVPDVPVYEQAQAGWQQTQTRLDRDIKKLESGKLSTLEFRKAWSAHFDSATHMDECTCYGICPFQAIITEKHHKKPA